PQGELDRRLSRCRPVSGPVRDLPFRSNGWLKTYLDAMHSAVIPSNRRRVAEHVFMSNILTDQFSCFGQFVQIVHHKDAPAGGRQIRVEPRGVLPLDRVSITRSLWLPNIDTIYRKINL